MTKPQSCSVVIRAYNEAGHIGRLLRGIQQQNLPEVEVILVDSGSTDGTVQIAQGFGVKLVQITPAEFTFGRSLNWGIEAASNDYVAIISAHCYPVYPDWLEKLIEPLAEPDVAICYGKQRGGETNQYSEHQWFKQYFPDYSIPQQGHAYCHNANSAIRKSLWAQHPFNEQLTGLEDLGWGSWAFQQGYKIAYSAKAEIIHLHDEKPTQVFNRYRREAIAMKQILPESRFSLWNFVRLASSTIFSDMLQARREGVLGKHWASILWFRTLQYWGTYRGYRYSGDVDFGMIQQFYYPPGILTEKTPAARDVEQIEY
jgi:glycosyltransferase involved in cell wall biosynthesis